MSFSLRSVLLLLFSSAALVVVSTRSLAQRVDKNTVKRSALQDTNRVRAGAPLVDEYHADRFYVSQKGSNGNMWRTFIFNNGLTKDEGSIAFWTGNGGDQGAGAVSFDVRPNGEVDILRGGRNGDPLLNFMRSSGWNRINTAGNLALAGGNQLVNADNPGIFIDANNNVGIGNAGIPADTKLLVSGRIKCQIGNIQVGLGAGSENGVLGTYTDNGLRLGANIPAGQYAFWLNHDNKYILLDLDKHPVSVSDANADKYGLFVMKGILSESYALAPSTTWADYVFKPGYRLADLDSVEAYIRENGHLPGIPSADTLAREGYSLHEMNVRFLEKIENLVLYAIGERKELDRQAQQIAVLQQQMDALREQLEMLKKFDTLQR